PPDWDIEVIQSFRKLPLIFKFNCHMAHIVAQPNMASDDRIDFSFIQSFVFQLFMRHWNKYCFIPVDEFLPVFQQTIRLWFDIKMNDLTSRQMKMMKIFQH